MESRYVHKSHNGSVLMCHVVCAAKYRRVVMSEHVDEVLKGVCLEIEKRHEIWFLEIGEDRDHAHFLVQSVPTYSAAKIVQTLKSIITAREVFAQAPEVKRKPWGGEFWGKGYFVNTVGQHGSEKGIAEYVKGQGEAWRAIGGCTRRRWSSGSDQCLAACCKVFYSFPSSPRRVFASSG